MGNNWEFKFELILIKFYLKKVLFIYKTFVAFNDLKIL